MAHRNIGVVIIGRNEGDRLRACLESLSVVDGCVYVDSGSTDNSVALAQSLGAATVALDPAQPFTAARARNAGIDWILKHRPQCEFVQTIDGDCTMATDWMAHAAAELAADPRRAVVFGRRRERYPRRNAYHRTCDDEWDVPLGAVHSCGGDALFRLAALREVGGYNGALIAGEEPDLCLRLRQRGWLIWSNGREMTSHDVAMSRFRQWWHRSRRTGFAISELIDLHGAAADPSWRRLLGSANLWSGVSVAAGAGLLVCALGDDPPVRGVAFVPFALCALQVARLAARKRRQFGLWPSVQWAGLMMTAKLAQAYGSLQYRMRRKNGRRTSLIEYKA